ncbi:hypothetical protein DAPPUDRAFT_111826 [Daphnia pulex]|uniref:Uncharacterized protein n=1 Tax=Daphnia pulex TaxID=6669 RepID=E9HA80_DAPPU|nr:hypothetical protein DAPPUDRAFT_111826 [Daphnia pulex]|eukprot:EFX71394.1 hypothetical protein DAPPUDRAFT_111826 [Daphnia pulex]
MVSLMSQSSTSSFIATYLASLDSAFTQLVVNLRYPRLPHSTSSLRTGSFGQQWCDTSLLLRDSGGLSSTTFILYFCFMDFTLILWPYVWYAVSAGAGRSKCRVQFSTDVDHQTVLGNDDKGTTDDDDIRSPWFSLLLRRPPVDVRLRRVWPVVCVGSLLTGVGHCRRTGRQQQCEARIDPPVIFRLHHVMTDETLPNFGCREASDPIALWTFPTPLSSDLVGFDLAFYNG